MDKTPVIIPAYNEEHRIGYTLSRLDATTTEPIVVSNGSTDRTVAIAASYGAHVIDREEPGKLQAMQAGVRGLGKRALEPVLFLDADAHPIYPRSWALAMIRPYLTHPAGTRQPGETNGMIAYTEGSLATNSLRTIHRAGLSIRSRARPGYHGAHGANISLNLASPGMRDAFLTMPPAWPEDGLIGLMILKNGGTFTQMLDPRTYVAISTRYSTPIMQRLRLGRQAYRQLRSDHYQARKPEARSKQIEIPAV